MEFSNATISNAATTASSIGSNPASDSKNRKPATAQQLIRENVQYLIEQLEAGRSEALTAYLDAMVHFRNYSFGNVLLIARQKPQATYVSGMWSWNQLGRRVKRGEKGIAILAPMIAKVRKEDQDSDGETGSGQQRALLGFRRVYVWDVSQTEGEPLPEPVKVTGDAGVYLDRLHDYIASQSITLEYNESIAPAQGMAFGTTIRILPGQTQAEEFSTTVHELAHLMLKHSERRSAITKTVRETEAEAIAFVVGKSVGLTTSTASADYISLYHGNAALLAESLELVQQTAGVILTAIQPEESAEQKAATGTAQPEDVPPVAEAAAEPRRARRSRQQPAIETHEAIAEVA
ncbi:MAG: ArdC family protein [Terracidiphilus sp.]|nr:ArdC family protein [Terracidiphilus sp.]MDR3799390.1 ArdC family protein [Terracidiphilus sp.]